MLLLSVCNLGRTAIVGYDMVTSRHQPLGIEVMFDNAKQVTDNRTIDIISNLFKFRKKTHFDKHVPGWNDYYN